MTGKCWFINVWLYWDKYNAWREEDMNTRSAKCGLCIKGSTFQTWDRLFHPGDQCDTCCQLQCFSLVHHQTGDHVGCCVHNETLTPEVLWAQNVGNANCSYLWYVDTSQFFQIMFPDSQIAAGFACGEHKCSNTVYVLLDWLLTFRNWLVIMTLISNLIFHVYTDIAENVRS